jgi:hypothetical protein
VPRGSKELNGNVQAVVAIHFKVHAGTVDDKVAPGTNSAGGGFCTPEPGHPRRMSERVTYEQAAGILGTHVSNIPKLIGKGQLTSTGERGASLDRDQVEALRDRRDAERAAQTQRPRRPPLIDRRPDADHDWLTTRQVAELVGITKAGVIGRIHRERLPAVENGRLWVRRDLLEQVEAARLAQNTRRPYSYGNDPRDVKG